MNRYTPRRASKRWLEGAPEYVLDCLKVEGTYSILFTGSLLGAINGEPQDFTHVYVMGLDIEADGRWASFELDAYHAAQFRSRNSHKRLRWIDLPKAVRISVRRWAKTDIAS